MLYCDPAQISANVPAILLYNKRWILWGDGKGPDAKGKINKQPWKSTTAEEWDSTPKLLKMLGFTRASGVGYVFTGSTDRVVGIDADGVIDDGGVPTELGRALLSAFPNTYCEYSPRRKGLHFLALGDVEKNLLKKVADHCQVEVYTGSGAAHYLTITGWCLPGRERALYDFGGSVESTIAEAINSATETSTEFWAPFYTDKEWKAVPEKIRGLLVGTRTRGERSELIASCIARELRHRRSPDDLIRLLLTAPGTLSYLQKHKDPEAFARQEVERVQEFVGRKQEESDSALEALNEEYAVVDDCGAVHVVANREDFALKRTRLVRYSMQGFRDLLRHKSVVVGEEKPKLVPLAEAWLSWPQRKQYKGIVLDPDCTDPGYYNLWRGWAVEPAPGDWELLKNHVAQVICNNDSRLMDYLLKWMALLVQQPGVLPGVALVLRGAEGVGKSFFGQMLLRLAGSHGLQVSNAKHVTGHFNSHLQNTVVLLIDDASIALDATSEGVLKALITDPVCVIEAKGRDSYQHQNLLHIVITSNLDRVVPAGLEARRYCVLQVSNTHRNDFEYFEQLQQALDTPECLSAMLYELMHVETSLSAVRTVPNTKALTEQKLQSLDSLHGWYVNLLSSGCNSVWEESGWLGSVPTAEVYNSYLQHMQKHERARAPVNQIVFGRRMRPLIERVTTREKKHCYVFGTLAEARTRFCEVTKLPVSVFD